MALSTKQKQTYRADFCQERRGGAMDWEFGVSRCKLLMHRLDAKNIERNVYLCISESFCLLAEVNTIL